MSSARGTEGDRSKLKAAPVRAPARPPPKLGGSSSSESTPEGPISCPCISFDSFGFWLYAKPMRFIRSRSPVGSSLAMCGGQERCDALRTRQDRKFFFCAQRFFLARKRKKAESKWDWE